MRQPSLRVFLALITGAWVVVLLAWTVALPTYRSADEPHHVSAAQSLRVAHAWPGYQQLPTTEEVWRTLAISGQERAGDYYALATEDAQPRPERPAIEAGATARSGPNSIGQHPPGYYALAAGVMTLTPATVAYDLQVWLLRLMSVALMAPLPALLAATAARLGGDRPAVVSAAIFPFLVPQIGALGGAVNNDNLLIVACVTVSWLAARVATGDLRLRTGVGIGFALAVGLLAKAWALVFVPVVGAVYALAALRARNVRPVLRPALAALATSALGAWWWVRNLLVFGALQPAGHKPALPDGPLDPLEGLGLYVSRALARIPERFWATLSIKTGPPPFPRALTVYLFFLLVTLVVVFGLRRRSYGAGRGDALLLALPFLASLVILIASTWSLYLTTGAAGGLQGRYLFAAIAGPAMAVALGVMSTLTPRWRRGLTRFLAVGGGLFVGASLRKVVAFHYEGDGLVDQLVAFAAWSPLPYAVSLTLLGLAVLALLAVPVATVAALRPGRVRAPSPVEDQAIPRNNEGAEARSLDHMVRSS